MGCRAIMSRGLVPGGLVPARRPLAGRPSQATWSLLELHHGRSISRSWLEKVAQGEERWKERAEKIKNGEEPHVWDILNERGYVKDLAGTTDQIREIMRVKRVGAYVGVDPTSDSLHIGHLVPLMALFWVWFHGHPVVTLLGGSTARIGDPTGRSKSRDIISNSDVSKNVAKMHLQITRLWHNVCELRRKFNYLEDWAARRHFLNNSMWQTGLSMYDFTKRLARHTRMGPLLSRDLVKQRLEGGGGMSLGEFMYPLFQGWDFWHLYHKLGIQIQIGGSDQYGNIVSGIETLKVIRETEEAPHAKMPTDPHSEPLGFTVPLITDSSGAKLGKTEGNAVWLDPFKTSAFDLYGYFVRQPDQDVERLLNLFTFLPSDRIQTIIKEHNEDPSAKLAQHTLAFEASCLVHGSQSAVREAQQHKFCFGSSLPFIKEPDQASGHLTPNTAPRSDIQLPIGVLQLSPARLLLAAGLVESTNEGQRLVTQQGAYVAAQPGQHRGLVPGNLNWTPMKMWYPGETGNFVIDEKLLILRKGKHNVRIIELVNDEEWQKTGKIYPGQPYKGLVRRIKADIAAEAEKDGAKLTATEMMQELKQRMSRTVTNNRDLEFPDRDDHRAPRTREPRWMGRGRK